MDSSDIENAVSKYRVEDPDAELVREVFAHFGRAVYMANVLESGIAAALLVAEWRRNVQGLISREEFEATGAAFEAGCRRLTMGALVKRLRQQTDLPSTLSEALDEALAARNTLAHHFFWERAGDFMIAPEGQIRMIEECDGMTALFERVDALITAYVTPIRESFGLTDEMLATQRASLLADAEQRLRP